MSAASSLSLYQHSALIIQQLGSIPNLCGYVTNRVDSDSEDDEELEDPVTTLWNAFKKGIILCEVMNLFQPGIAPAIQNIETKNDAKKNIYKFMHAWQTILPEVKLNFNINDLLGDDTNVMAKALTAMDILLAKLQKENKLDFSLLPYTNAANDYSPSTNREKVVAELVETERKYVQDLETLQKYKDAINSRQLLSPQTVLSIFTNLDILVDFQRRFLIRVEAENSRSKTISKPFSELEEGFTVYETWCANHTKATELALNHVDVLMPLSDIIEPTRELASYFIKPVQRICKYPLLIKEMLRFTPEQEVQTRADLTAALKITHDVTAQINNANRTLANEMTRLDLGKRIIDWRGFRLEALGSLLLEAKLVVCMDDVDKEMHVFLFDRILLCCKEKKNKMVAIGSSNTSAPMLSIKGRVLMKQIQTPVAYTQGGTSVLKIFWANGTELESFTLRFVSEETLTLWKSTIDMALRDKTTASPSRDRLSSSLRQSMGNVLSRFSRASLPEDESQKSLDNLTNAMGGFDLPFDEQGGREQRKSRGGFGGFFGRKSGVGSQDVFANEKDNGQTNKMMDNLVLAGLFPSDVPLSPPSPTRNIGDSRSRSAHDYRNDSPHSPNLSGQTRDIMKIEHNVSLAQRLEERRRKNSSDPEVRQPHRDRSTSGRRLHRSPERHTISPKIRSPDPLRSVPTSPYLTSPKDQYMPPRSAGIPRRPDREDPEYHKSQHESTSASHRSGGSIKVRVSHKGEKFLLLISARFNFEQFSQKIAAKLGLSRLNDGNNQLRVIDEDGDHINMTGDDDLELALSSMTSKGYLQLTVGPT